MEGSFVEKCVFRSAVTEKRQRGRHRGIQGRRVAKGRVWLLNISWWSSATINYFWALPQGDAQQAAAATRQRGNVCQLQQTSVSMGPTLRIPTCAGRKTQP